MSGDHALLQVIGRPLERRVAADRLELLSVLLSGPTVPEVFRQDLMRFEPFDAVFGWRCRVPSCQAPSTHGGGGHFCVAHREEYARSLARQPELTRFQFQQQAVPLLERRAADPGDCRICLDRPTRQMGTDLCEAHYARWKRAVAAGYPRPQIEQWLEQEKPFRSFGGCVVAACHARAMSPLGLCDGHRRRYRSAGSPGGVRLSLNQWGSTYEAGRPVPLVFDDEVAFRTWCRTANVVFRSGQVSVAGLTALAKAELRWGLFAHSQHRSYTNWPLQQVQALVNHVRLGGWESFVEVEPGVESIQRMMVAEIRAALRLVYHAPLDTRDAGFILTGHFGVQLTGHASGHLDLTEVPQPWLRELLWDYLAGKLRDPKGPRGCGAYTAARRAATELGHFLAITAPEAGHEPGALTAAHMEAFVADQRTRARGRLPALGVRQYQSAEPAICTEDSRRVTFNHARAMLRRAMDNGTAEQIGLLRAFICALPSGGAAVTRKRSPFCDSDAHELADPGNLAVLAAQFDPTDRGVRDVWEGLVLTGRRANEIIQLRLDCTGRHSGLALLWHDQTKVHQFDEAIRIPDYLLDRYERRREITVARFLDRHGRQPTAAERKRMALFPSANRNPDFSRSISYGGWLTGFSGWVQQLPVGQVVPHQARHTLATRLLRSGATMSQIKKYLGQVSMRMAEHYAQIASTELEDVLSRVWVAGPGSTSPGQLLASPSGVAALDHATARALAVDLSRRSTPTEGGFCTFQPVVEGNACPWKLNCHTCDKLVLSGADLLYWRRKRDQWRSLAERAPDDATADYLHQAFAPTAQAIDGLERALSGLGLLEEALSLDLRRPQDYFQRIWSTAFRATDLAALDQPGNTDLMIATSAEVLA
jgi:hypothetical protein